MSNGVAEAEAVKAAKAGAAGSRDACNSTATAREHNS